MLAKRKIVFLLAAAVIILAWIICHQGSGKHPEANTVIISDYFRPAPS